MEDIITTLQPDRNGFKSKKLSSKCTWNIRRSYPQYQDSTDLRQRPHKWPPQTSGSSKRPWSYDYTNDLPIAQQGLARYWRYCEQTTGKGPYERGYGMGALEQRGETCRTWRLWKSQTKALGPLEQIPRMKLLSWLYVSLRWSQCLF